MKPVKRNRGLRQIILALLALWGVILLTPASVYGLVGAREGSHEESASSESWASAPPAFLDGASMPETGENLEEEPTFTLYDRTTETTLQLAEKELLPAAIACEMDLSAPEEALKAQAVACRTLFRRKRDAGETIVCDSAAWQIWTTQEQMEARWGEYCAANLTLLENVVSQTAGQILCWEGKPILAAYFAISAGNTESVGNIWEDGFPYLQAVASPGDMFSDGYLSTKVLTTEEFKEAVAAYFPDDPPELSDDLDSWLTDLEYTSSGYVSSAVLGGKQVSGTDLRSAFSLRSACFDVSCEEEEIRFTVRGWGHGVGMSQAGAAFMAKRGADYKEILVHYYPETQLTALS